MHNSAGARAIAPTPISSAGFARIPRDIAKRPDLTDAERALLLVLTAQAHYDPRLGRHRPVRISSSHLVHCLGWSEPKLRRVRAKLDDRKLLTFTPGDGRRRSEYRLQIEAAVEVVTDTTSTQRSMTLFTSAEAEAPMAPRGVQSVPPGVTRVTPPIPRASCVEKNVNVYIAKGEESDPEKNEALAQRLKRELNDQHSLGYHRLRARTVPHPILEESLAKTLAASGIRKPGALFVSILNARLEAIANEPPPRRRRNVRDVVEARRLDKARVLACEAAAREGRAAA